MNRLRILGFSQQKLVTPARVREALAVLPSSHIRHIGVIRYDPGRQVAAAINNYLEPVPGTVRGSYYKSETMQAVVLWRFDTVAEFYHIFYHEIGHHAFMYALTQEQRDLWLYEVRVKEKVTVTSYACTNSKEDFSECYASWFFQPEVLRRCQLRYRYFADHVFRELSK